MTMRMTFLPSIWKHGEPLQRHEGVSPFYSLHQEMNEIFDDLWRSFGIEPFCILEGRSESFVPFVDVSESDGKLSAVVELPGMDENDVEVLLTPDALIIKGEKKEEQEEKKNHYYCTERSSGQFTRVIELPREIDATKVEARFKNGVLSIDMPIRGEVEAKGTKVQVKVE